MLYSVLDADSFTDKLHANYPKIRWVETYESDYD